MLLYVYFTSFVPIYNVLYKFFLPRFQFVVLRRNVRVGAVDTGGRFGVGTGPRKVSRGHTTFFMYGLLYGPGLHPIWAGINNSFYYILVSLGRNGKGTTGSVVCCKEARW